MKKTLFTLLTATSLMSTSFAASTPQLTDTTPSEAGEKATPLSIKINNVLEILSGVQIPSLQWNPSTNQFIGSKIELIIPDICTIVLSRDKSIITISQIKRSYDHQNDLFLKAAQKMKLDLNQLHLPENYYAALCLAVSVCTNEEAINPSVLLKLRKITADVFSSDPKSWMTGDLNKLYDLSRKASMAALNKYHIPSLTKSVKEKMDGLSVSDETITKIVQDTYDLNIKSEGCREEIKATFMEISEILATAAYHCRAEGTTPTTLFSDKNFYSEVAALLIILFNLDDRDIPTTNLNILGEDVELVGIPPLSDIQKEFATRWVNTVLSPYISDTKVLKTSEQDGFAFIPDIVKKAEELWEEFARYVFGKTVSVIFDRNETVDQMPSK